MPVTKYFAKVWSSPKQKEQIFFRVDPTTQRPLRIGCRCSRVISIGTFSGIELSFSVDMTQLILNFTYSTPGLLKVDFYNESNYIESNEYQVSNGLNTITTTVRLTGSFFYAVIIPGDGSIHQSNTIHMP